MARIFRTETLNLNGNIRLDSSATDAFEIKTVDGSTLMSRSSIESDISSLQAKDTKNESDLSVDVSSLAAIDSGHDTDISSLQAADVKNESDLSVDISSLQAADVKNESDLSVDVSSLAAIDSGHDTDISSLAAVSTSGTSDLDVDISSLAAVISTNDVVAKSVGQSSGAEGSGSISFGRTFTSTPTVIAVLKSTNASDPIIACMVTAVSTTACTVSFADGLPSGNYTVEIIASIAD